MDMNPVKKGSPFSTSNSSDPRTEVSRPFNFVLTPFRSPQSLFDNKFDDIFGSSFSSDPFNFNSQNGVNKDEK